MFKLEHCTAKAELRTQREIDAIIEAAFAEQQPLLRSLLRQIKATASLRNRVLRPSFFSSHENSWARPNIPVGDAVFTDSQILLVQPLGSRLSVFEIRLHDAPSALPDVCSRIEAAAKDGIDGRRVRGMDFEWKHGLPTPTRRRRPGLFDTSRLTTTPAELSDSGIAAADLLAVGDHRAAVLKLAQLGKARLADPAFQSTNPVMAELLAADLVHKEYLLTCRQDSHTHCTLTDRQTLETFGRELRCNVCSRLFSDELIHEIVSLAPKGKELITRSKWMTVWATSAIVKLGIPLTDIEWNAAAGEDELDIIVKINGARVFFELKDREFGLGDAYPFAARVPRYGGDFGIVLSTDGIAEEAKRYLQEGAKRKPEFFILDSSKAIQAELPEVLATISRKAILNLLAEIGGLLSPITFRAITEWLAIRDKRAGHENPVMERPDYEFVEDLSFEDMTVESDSA